MGSYIIRRLLYMIPTMFGITLVTFFAMALSPGGVSAAALAQQGILKPFERKALEDYYNRRYGLNKPLYIQYFNWLNKISPIGAKSPGEGYPADWRVGLKIPDLGRSFAFNQQVSTLIAQSLPITLILDGLSVPLIYSLSLISGIRAARRRGEWEDVTTGTLFLGMWSFPSILAGVLMVGFLANREYFRWFPTTGLHDDRADAMAFLPHITGAGFQRGYLLDYLWHLAMPVICLSYSQFAFVAKLSRSAVLESITSDYVRTARAKGASERTILYRHAFRNSLIPVITLAAQILPTLLSGSIIVESIFGLNGMGKLTVDAVLNRDRELVLSTTVIAGVLGLLAYLVADIAYAIVDPRVSYE